MLLQMLKLQLQSTQDDSSARMERLRTDSATEISEMRRREEELQGETLGLVEERFEALRARNSELEVEQVYLNIHIIIIHKGVCCAA